MWRWGGWEWKENQNNELKEAKRLVDAFDTFHKLKHASFLITLFACCVCFHLICLGESCSRSYPRFFLCHMWCWSDLDLCALEIKRCQDDSPATGPAARRNRCKQFLTVIFLGDLKQQTTSRSTNPSVTLRCLCSQLYLYHLDIKPSQGPLQSREGLVLLYSVSITKCTDNTKRVEWV